MLTRLRPLPSLPSLPLSASIATATPSASSRIPASSTAAIPSFRSHHLITDGCIHPFTAGIHRSSRGWTQSNSNSNSRRGFATTAWKIRRAEIRKHREAERQAKRPQETLPPIRILHDPADHAPAKARSYPKMGRNPKLQFAVIQTMGRQYKVVPGDLLMVERLKHAEVNQNVVFPRVLLHGTRDETIIGRPAIPGAAVHATVEEHTTTKRIIVFKKKRRKGYEKHHGFAETVTLIRINDIYTGPEASSASQTGGHPQQAPEWISELESAIPLERQRILLLQSHGPFLGDRTLPPSFFASESDQPSDPEMEKAMNADEDQQGEDGNAEAGEAEAEEIRSAA